MIEEVDFSPAKEPPTLKRFAKSDAFVRFVVGPVGSGKSTRCVREIVRRALRQKRGHDGIRRSRFVVIRNTYGQLRDTTRKTFEQWVPAWMGTWHEQSFTFHMQFDDVDCEVLFRALDRPEDVRKLLSLELTGAYINEAREIPKHVLDVLETRVGRFPSQAQGGFSWRGIWADTNPWHGGHWGAKLFSKNLPGYELYRQPGGRSPNAENIENLERGYYERLCVGKDSEYVKVYVDGEDGDSATGAIFGPWIAGLQARGGICAFDHPKTDVYVSWDLGKADATALWFWRINAERRVDVIDHYENAGQGLSHYLGILDEKGEKVEQGKVVKPGYRYVRHWLPHDAKAETLATQQTVLEQVAQHFGVSRVAITPDIGLDDGIGAARWLLEEPIRIHERCDVPGRFEHSGLQALREYRWEWDEENLCFSTNPLHNWASHTADAFRYLAVVAKVVEKLTRPEKQDQKPAYVLPVAPTLDQLWEMQPKPSGRI